MAPSASSFFRCEGAGHGGIRSLDGLEGGEAHGAQRHLQRVEAYGAEIEETTLVDHPTFGMGAHALCVQRKKTKT